MKTRNLSIDLIRSICCLYIIGFWHLVEYTSFSCKESLFMQIGAFFTVIAMACFSFISGVCMQKYTFNEKKDCVIFLKKRLIRFFPLFFLSALSLFCAGLVLPSSWFINTSQFILTVTGTSLLFPPTAPTLWFISMCMLFYYITPLILWKRSKMMMTCVRVFILLLFLYLSHYLSNGVIVDFKLLIYLPLYIFGLFFPYTKISGKQLITLVSCLTLTLVMCFYFGYASLSSPLFCIILGISGTLFFVMVSRVLSATYIISKIPIRKISYASMTAYLFHRQIYELIYILIGNFNVILSIVSVSIVFSLAYNIQSIYDKLLRNLSTL